MRALLTGALLALLVAAPGARADDVTITREQMAQCAANGLTDMQRLDCFRKLAEAGDEFSQFALGMIYFEGVGEGFVRDRIEADKWLTIAVRHDPKNAAKVKWFEWRMTPEQVALGREAAAKWLELHSQLNGNSATPTSPEVRLTPFIPNPIASAGRANEECMACDFDGP